MIDLNDLMHGIRTDWAKLDHAVTAAAAHQWRRVCQGQQQSFRVLF